MYVVTFQIEKHVNRIKTQLKNLEYKIQCDTKKNMANKI